MSWPLDGLRKAKSKSTPFDFAQGRAFPQRRREVGHPASSPYIERPPDQEALHLWKTLSRG